MVARGFQYKSRLLEMLAFMYVYSAVLNGVKS